MKVTIIKRTGDPSSQRFGAVVRCEPPMYGHEYVWVSAIRGAFGDLLSGGLTETYIFPCTAAGDVTDWCEMPGSFQGDADIEAALANAGYRLVDEGGEG